MRDKKANWNDINQLPQKQCNGWSIWKKGRQIDTSVSEIESLVSRWLPANALLIGSPKAKTFLPPVLVPEFKATALRTVRNNSRNLTVAFIACGLVFLSFNAYHPTSQGLSFGFLLLALGMVIWTDYMIALRHCDGLADRALFFRWLKTNPLARANFLIYGFMALAIGLSQLTLHLYLGGLEAVFNTLGVMYEKVNSGEYWRLLTGPYLHYSITHLLINVVLLVFAGTLASTLFGRWIVAIFFILGNILSAYIQMTLGGNTFDNYGGISGGVYTLLGVMVGGCAINRQWLPKGFWLLVFNVTIMGIISAEAVSESAATVAHISGLTFGCLAGIYYGLQKSMHYSRS